MVANIRRYHRVYALALAIPLGISAGIGILLHDASPVLAVGLLCLIISLCVGWFAGDYIGLAEFRRRRDESCPIHGDHSAYPPGQIPAGIAVMLPTPRAITDDEATEVYNLVKTRIAELETEEEQQ